MGGEGDREGMERGRGEKGREVRGEGKRGGGAVSRFHVFTFWFTFSTSTFSD